MNKLNPKASRGEQLLVGLMGSVEKLGQENELLKIKLQKKELIDGPRKKLIVAHKDRPVKRKGGSCGTPRGLKRR
tara:strand:- start:212 stop:436 length:225 start_codon:yes stop_codon:yes gene_type:complete